MQCIVFADSAGWPGLREYMCITAYGRCALIRIGNQPPLGMAENRITVIYIELKATRIKLTLKDVHVIIQLAPQDQLSQNQLPWMGIETA